MTREERRLPWKRGTRTPRPPAAAPELPSDSSAATWKSESTKRDRTYGKAKRHGWAFRWRLTPPQLSNRRGGQQGDTAAAAAASSTGGAVMAIAPLPWHRWLPVSHLWRLPIALTHKHPRLCVCAWLETLVIRVDKILAPLSWTLRRVHLYPAT